MIPGSRAALSSGATAPRASRRRRQRGASLVQAIFLVSCVGMLALGAYAASSEDLMNALNKLGAHMLGREYAPPPPAP